MDLFRKHNRERTLIEKLLLTENSQLAASVGLPEETLLIQLCTALGVYPCLMKPRLVSSSVTTEGLESSSETNGTAVII